MTLNFHPDRISRNGVTVAAGLLRDGVYHSQWITGISAGSRSARPDGERARFERDLFDDAYDAIKPASGGHPVYGALDLLFDDHGGSPRFGSCFVVLHDHVRHRTTLCAGDSHLRPSDVGTFDEPWSVLAALSEQAEHNDLLNRRLGPDALFAALDSTFRSDGASRDLDGYIEAQVHGGVSLAHDVEAIVLDPSFGASDVERDMTSAARRYGFEVAWHAGSELAVADVPDDFRGPTMRSLARQVAGVGGVVHARAIGVAAARVAFDEPLPDGDPPESPQQQLKYLWHTVLACGHDAAP